MAQCYGSTWAMLAQVKINWANIANGSSIIECWQLVNINVIHCN